MSDSVVKRIRWRRGLREVGLLLLGVSIFFLPWFQINFPYRHWLHAYSLVISGTDLLARGVWLVWLGFLLACVAYVVSKARLWSEQFVASVLALAAINLFALAAWMYLIREPGLHASLDLTPFFRSTYGFDPRVQTNLMLGPGVSLVGVLLLGIGVSEVQGDQERGSIATLGRWLPRVAWVMVLGWAMFWYLTWGLTDTVYWFKYVS